jgi:hypothetical protein
LGGRLARAIRRGDRPADKDLPQVLRAAFGPTLPISNVRYHGEYRGYTDVPRTAVTARISVPSRYCPGLSLPSNRPQPAIADHLLPSVMRRMMKRAA